MPRLTRKRWRRPERLTLEGPPIARRKDFGAPTILTLEPDLQQRYTRGRLRAMGAAFFAASALEGLLVGLVVRRPLVAAAAGAILGLLYLAAASALGGGWMRRYLGAETARNPRVNRVSTKAAEGARVVPPQVLVIRDPGMDALAIGLGPHAVVVTTGSLNVDDLVLEGMITHEIVHLRDGDARVAGMYALLADGARLLPANAARPAGLPLVLALPLWPASLVVRALGGVWLSGEHCHRADVGAALLTRYPPGLEEALRISARKAQETRRRGALAWFGADAQRRADLVREM